MKQITETHEWIEIIDGEATIGVTDLAQRELGDIVYVELPKVGTKVEKGQVIAVLESTKAAVDVYTPQSGVVIAINERLTECPGLINRSSEDEGWILKLSP